MEQFTKADLLVVKLFENRREVTNQKGVPTGAGGLIPPFYALEKLMATPRGTFI